MTLVENAAPSGASLAMLAPGTQLEPFAMVLGLSAADPAVASEGPAGQEWTTARDLVLWAPAGEDINMPGRTS